MEAASAAAAASPAWHARLGGLVVDRAALKAARPGGGGGLPPSISRAVAALDDTEPRVRLAACDVLGSAAAASHGLAVWEAARPTLLRLIARDWDRDAATDENEVGGEEAAPGGGQGARPPVTATTTAPPLPGVSRGATTTPITPPATTIAAVLASSYAPQPPGAGEMRHGTEGWRCLETAVRALLAIMDGCGEAFKAVVAAGAPGGEEVVGLVTRAALHPNRFVREGAYGALGGLAALLGPAADADPAAASFILGAARRLGSEGLAENWSQVRLAACVAARSLLRACPPPPSPTRAAALAALLPALALNRYDAAEGVAAYSQATWAAVTGGAGAQAVAEHAGAVVGLYLKSAKTNNHQVREAAALCCGELATKVERGAVAPHATAILKSLILASKDDAWPVRDAAGRALAQLATAFPELVGGTGSASACWAAWAGALDDNVPSVRSGAAASLVAGSVALDGAGVGLPAGGLPGVGLPSGGLPAVPAGASLAPPPPGHPAIAAAGGLDTFLGAAVALALASLARVADQPAGGSAHPPPRGLAPPPPPGAPPSAASLFVGGAGGGLLRPRRDTGGIDFSCGCMDYSYKRGREAWEAADGGLRLVGALGEAKVGEGESEGARAARARAVASAVALLPALADAATASHYTAHWSLRETASHAVRSVLAGAGPRAVKSHLEAVLPPLLACLGPGAGGGGGGGGGGGAGAGPLARSAAGCAVAALRDTVGPRIFAGRLDEGQRALVEASPDVPPPGGRFCVGGGGGSGGGAAASLPAFGQPTRAPWAGGQAAPAIPPPPGAGLRPEGYCPGGFPMRHT